jgi:hypothetical protein
MVPHVEKTLHLCFQQNWAAGGTAGGAGKLGTTLQSEMLE